MEKNNNNPPNNDNSNINNPKRLFDQKDKEQFQQVSNTYLPPQTQDNDKYKPSQFSYTSQSNNNDFNNETTQTDLLSNNNNLNNTLKRTEKSLMDNNSSNINNTKTTAQYESYKEKLANKQTNQASKPNTNQNQQQYQSNGYSNHNANSSNRNNTNVNNKIHNNYQPPNEEPNNNGAIWKIFGCLGVSLLALLLCGFLIYQAVSGILNNSNDKNDKDNKTEQTTNENDKTTEQNNETQDDTANTEENATKDDENSNATVKNGNEVSFDEGFYKVGEDIKPGRYLIGSKNRGNLFITEGNRAYFINEIVGSGDEDVIAQIEDGQKIEIKTANDVVFKPIEDKMYKDELLAGVYIVGKHIEPGEYKFIATDEGFTSITTFKEENGEYNSKNYYSLNIKDEKETDVTLNEGEILNIQNAVKVKIEKQ